MDRPGHGFENLFSEALNPYQYQALLGSRTCSEANIMRGIEEYKDKKYIKVIFNVLTKGLYTFRTQKYEWITLDMGSKTSFPKFSAMLI